MSPSPTHKIVFIYLVNSLGSGLHFPKCAGRWDARNVWRNEGAEGSSRRSAAHGAAMLDFSSESGSRRKVMGREGQKRRLTAFLSWGQVRKPTVTTWDQSPDHTMLQIPLGLSRAKVA